MLAFQDNYIWRAGRTDIPGQPMLVVDPGDAAPVMADLDALGSPLAAILITHHHADHVGGIQALKRRWPDAPVFGPANCVTHGVERVVSHGDTVNLPALGFRAEVIATPGHTADHLSYFCPALPGQPSPVLFCGDTLFAAGCGRIFDGTIEQQFRSLTTLAMLPMETLVYAAHEYTLTNLHFALQAEPNNHRIQQRLEHCLQLRAEGLPTLPSTMGMEAATNPFLRSHLPTLGANLPAGLVPRTPNALSVFQALRSWRNDFRPPN
ncbi:MAG: hydroxyacylglutathione hydrolase [Lautropia sp.]|nr:hydroxyacylglutathione hydrolase [Lautropia sp.]